MQKLLIVGLMIFVTACVKNTPSQISNCPRVLCQPVYGRRSDWDVISDDLARNIYRHNKICEEYNK